MEKCTELINQIDKYYEEVIVPYKKTTMDALTTAKKMGLFKKQNFDVHIDNFKAHMKRSLEFHPENISISEEDTASISLCDQFKKSLASFISLCGSNTRFYECADKKQHRDSGIKMKDYKAAYDAMQISLATAVTDLDELDKAYQEYKK